MKKKFALLLSVFLIIASVMPLQVFADGDKGLEDALIAAKSMFKIPDNYTEFNYDAGTRNNKRVWHLYWQSKNGEEGSMNVSVDEKGNIINYSNYKPIADSSAGKLPKYSFQQAKTIAENFINHINPGLMSQLKYNEDNDYQIYSSIHNSDYYLYYNRVVNNIPFTTNNVRINVNRQTGEVINFNLNWNDQLKFPTTEGVIPVDKAQQAYMEKLGLELQYMYTYEDEKMKVFPVYAQKYQNKSYIDAYTGEAVDLSYRYSTSYDMAMSSKMAEKNAIVMAAGGMGAKVELSEEELKAVEKVSKLLTKEEAEKISRNLKVLELTDEFKLTNYNLSRSWPDRKAFIWRLTFNKAGSDKLDTRYVSVSIDALNGEIKDFNTYYRHNESEKAKYNENAARTAAEALAKELQPVKFNETFYDSSNNDLIKTNATDMPANYNITYIRKVNGVPFPGNAINIGYDAINGKITSFNLQWFNTEIPSANNAVSLNKVYEKLFGEIGLGLEYITERKPDYASGIYDMESNEQNVRLVFSIKPGKPVLFDAYTGDIINYDSKPYTEKKAIEYTDITGHYAESQIKVLAENGISLEGSEFKPDQSITQLEFLTLLSKTLDYYVAQDIKEDEKTDNLYAFLIRSGIVKANEKSPESLVTKEETAKFIIRAMKADKIADIKGIYYCDFVDADQIKPELIGYVTIAKGLGIINGYEGVFNPRAELSRADAAIVIYNYLQE